MDLVEEAGGLDRGARSPDMPPAAAGYSRSFLCDLQVHTSADNQHRYGDVGGREPNEAFAKRLMEAHAAAGVEVIAVTDHNRVDWYPTLHAAGSSVGVTVFPGLEFSVNGCHLLAGGLTRSVWTAAAITIPPPPRSP